MYNIIVRLQGWICLITGICLLAFSLFFELSLLQEHPNTKLIWDFLQALGISVLGFGIFGILMETKNWRQYFGSRLSEIVMEDEYLSRMDRDTLKHLQIKVLKALSKNDDIDREGSFLNYFHENLHQYISEPFREDVSTEIIFQEEVDKGYKIYDRVTYVCRASGGKIQDKISWKPDENEFVSLLMLKIEVQYPYNHKKAGKREILFPANKNIDFSNCGNEPVDISLDESLNIDRLIVTVTSEYIVDKERFQYWQMAHPTRNFDITISFPNTYKIHFKPLVINPFLCQITPNEDSQIEGYLKIKYDSWMLPQSGLAWRFSQKLRCPQIHAQN